MDDEVLLRDYAESGSERAFGLLVERHGGWVFGACRRMLRDGSLAEDAAQAVFVLLATKARRISGARLGGWLFKAARYTCAEVRRREETRRRHEEKAAIMNATQDGMADTLPWTEAEDQLEECMARLGAKDRTALLMRFYQGRSFGEISTMLGISEDAAKKRVGRAVERLRHIFACRGVALSGEKLSAGLGALVVPALSTATVQATTSMALAAAKGSAAVGPAVIAKGAMTMMKVVQIKTAAVAMAAAIAVAGAGVVLVKTTMAADPAPAAGGAAGQTEVRTGNGVVINTGGGGGGAFGGTGNVTLRDQTSVYQGHTLFGPFILATQRLEGLTDAQLNDFQAQSEAMIKELEAIQKQTAQTANWGGGVVVTSATPDGNKVSTLVSDRLQVWKKYEDVLRGELTPEQLSLWDALRMKEEVRFVVRMLECSNEQLALIDAAADAAGRKLGLHPTKEESLATKGVCWREVYANVLTEAQIGKLIGGGTAFDPQAANPFAGAISRVDGLSDEDRAKMNAIGEDFGTQLKAIQADRQSMVSGANVMNIGKKMQASFDRQTQLITDTFAQLRAILPPDKLPQWDAALKQEQVERRLDRLALGADLKQKIDAISAEAAATQNGITDNQQLIAANGTMWKKIIKDVLTDSEIAELFPERINGLQGLRTGGIPGLVSPVIIAPKDDGRVIIRPQTSTDAAGNDRVHIEVHAEK